MKKSRLEHFKKSYSRALRRHSSARILEYHLYTAGLRSSFLALHRLYLFLKRSNLKSAATLIAFSKRQQAQGVFPVEVFSSVPRFFLG